ncbi:MAG: gamma-butyrobetaine hydroxylase-like domain-containing protein [Rhodanobacteraceae bacterium]
MPAVPKPTEITLHKQSRTLEVAFDSGERFVMPCEYLRVHSPSAEVQGHGPGERVLVAGKRDVNISAIEPVGNYAVLLRFSDGHATGIFSWETLYDLGINQDTNWQSYLDALEKNQLSREPKSPYGHPVPMRGPKPR